MKNKVMILITLVFVTFMAGCSSKGDNNETIQNNDISTEITGDTQENNDSGIVNDNTDTKDTIDNIMEGHVQELDQEAYEYFTGQSDKEYESTWDLNVAGSVHAPLPGLTPVDVGKPEETTNTQLTTQLVYGDPYTGTIDIEIDQASFDRLYKELSSNLESNKGSIVKIHGYISDGKEYKEIINGNAQNRYKLNTDYNIIAGNQVMVIGSIDYCYDNEGNEELLIQCINIYLEW